MAVPPPPPPPLGGLKLGVASGNSKGPSGGGDTRSALLQSIQKGAKLKKTVTVDKSGPAISGKVTSSSSPANRSPPSHGVASGASNNNIGNGGMPKLGGIFEGMSTMPKLKPVGGRGTCLSTIY